MIRFPLFNNVSSSFGLFQYWRFVSCPVLKQAKTGTFPRPSCLALKREGKESHTRSYTNFFKLSRPIPRFNLSYLNRFLAAYSTVLYGRVNGTRFSCFRVCEGSLPYCFPKRISVIKVPACMHQAARRLVFFPSRPCGPIVRPSCFLPIIPSENR